MSPRPSSIAATRDSGDVNILGGHYMRVAVQGGNSQQRPWSLHACHCSGCGSVGRGRAMVRSSG